MVASLGRPVRDVNHNETAVLHLVGLLVGATLTAATLVVIGQATPSSARHIVGEVCLGAASLATVSQLAGRRPPQSHWQVPSVWRQTVDPTILPLAYGFLLGMGVWTAVVVSAFWAFLAATPLMSPWVALVGWLIYAAARGAGFLGGSSICALPGRRSLARPTVIVSSSIAALALTLVALQPL